MKKYDVKDQRYFTVLGSMAIKEEGFKRLLNKDIETFKKVNGAAAYFALNSAGIQIRFKTNSKKININVNLGEVSNMNNMSALGQSGVDLYIYHKKLNKYVFQNSTPFDRFATEYDFALVNNEEKEYNDYIINLPLYNFVSDLSLFLDEDATIIPYQKQTNDTIVFYGSSIVQGGTVSRPGFLYSNIISRKIKNEIFNFGFSGSAFLEKEIAAIISKVLNPKILIIDAEPNAGADNRLKDNLPGFIEEYRKNHPKTTILVCSRISYPADLKNKVLIKRRASNKAFMIDLVNNLKKEDKNIFFVDGYDAFGDDFFEYSLDGTHPNDLGATKLADFYYKEILKYL